MINLYVSLKELNVLYHKRDIEIAIKPPTLFRVRTGLKSGSDCANELLWECRDRCGKVDVDWGCHCGC